MWEVNSTHQLVKVWFNPLQIDRRVYLDSHVVLQSLAGISLRLERGVDPPMARSPCGRSWTGGYPSPRRRAALPLGARDPSPPDQGEPQGGRHRTWTPPSVPLSVPVESPPPPCRQSSSRTRLALCSLELVGGDTVHPRQSRARRGGVVARSTASTTSPGAGTSGLATGQR